MSFRGTTVCLHCKTNIYFDMESIHRHCHVVVVITVNSYVDISIFSDKL